MKTQGCTINDLILYVHGAAAFQVVHAGCEFEIFEKLNANKTMSFKALEKFTKLPPESLRTLLWGLTSLKVIEYNGRTYKNSDIINKIFAHSEWMMFKTLVMIQAHIMYITQADYIDALKTNTNAGMKRISGKGKTLYTRLMDHPKIHKVFYNYMEAYSEYANPHLLKNIDLKNAKSAIDVGGGGGKNAILLAKHFPNLHITLLDLPVAEKIAKKNIQKNKMKDRVSFLTCDMFKNNFPAKQDVVFFIHQLVIWSREENEYLLKKAYRSLNKNGKVIIFSSMGNDSENGPVMAALDTVYFRCSAAGRGMIYPPKDYKEVLQKIGFKRIQFIKCDTWTPHGIIIAYK